MSRSAWVSAYLLILLCCGLWPSRAGSFNLGKEIGHCFHGGCDVVWSLNQRFDEGIRSKSRSMIEPAREAFLQAMDVLFDKKLNPLIDKLNTDFSDRLDQANQILQLAERGVDEIIDRAAEKASFLERQAVDDIRQQIIDTSFKQANELVDQLNSRIRELIADIDCKFTGQAGGIEEYIKATFSFVPHPLDECYRSNGFTWSLPEGRDYVNIYAILECQYQRDLRNSISVGQIKKNYSRLISLARRFQCIEQGNHEFHQLTAQHVRIASQQFEIWLLASQ